jgi:hypothetical protein
VPPVLPRLTPRGPDERGWHGCVNLMRPCRCARCAAWPPARRAGAERGACGRRAGRRMPKARYNTPAVFGWDAGSVAFVECRLRVAVTVRLLQENSEFP